MTYTPASVQTVDELREEVRYQIRRLEERIEELEATVRQLERAS